MMWCCLTLAACLAVEPIPPGAAALGYTRCIFDEHPTVADIAPDRNGDHKWFSGQWYAGNPPTLDHYADAEGELAIRMGGDLVSTPRDFSKGALPLLPGSAGFYVEFEVRLSDWDPDHFPAVWLMPAEHNGKKPDHYEGDPPGYERWMEFDIDEGGFGPGLTGTVHSWTGIWEEGYQHLQNGNNVRREPLDRTQRHTFGGSYDPRTQTVAWWVDGEFQMSATAPYVPEVAAKQNFYLIMGAQHRKENRPYTMFIAGVRAYTLPEAEVLYQIPLP